MVLTDVDPTGSGAKRSADADIVEARHVEIVRGERVQAVDFVSDDPAFAGTMTMTWSVHASASGALIEFIADDVPSGIAAEDHGAGMASSLENLARNLER